MGRNLHAKENNKASTGKYSYTLLAPTKLEQEPSEEDAQVSVPNSSAQADVHRGYSFAATDAVDGELPAIDPSPCAS